MFFLVFAEDFVDIVKNIFMRSRDVPQNFTLLEVKRKYKKQKRKLFFRKTSKVSEKTETKQIKSEVCDIRQK